MRILLLTRYPRKGASSRVRSFQYLSHLEAEGFGIDVSPFFTERHLEMRYAGGTPYVGDVVTSYLRRLAMLSKAARYDLLWFEKELFPFLPATAERMLHLFRIPFVVDYDDALFHSYDRHPNPLIRTLLRTKISTVMRHAALVIAGNQYLASYARNAGARRVEIVPTVVDTGRYTSARSENGTFTIGWIGTPITVTYLRLLEPALHSLRRSGPFRLVTVGAHVEMDGIEVECRPWSEEEEAEEIRRFDVGVMPLPDNPWERGKCGYKLIQYMASGKPVVASPVGANRDIVEDGANGYLASTPEDWVRRLEQLRDADHRIKLGSRARRSVEERFSLQGHVHRLIALLLSAT